MHRKDMNHDSDNEKNESFGNEFRNRNPFQVPDGYFEQLPSEIQNRIISKQPVKKVPVLFRPAYFVPVLALLVLSLILLRPAKNTAPTSQNAGFDYSDFVTEHYDDLGIDENTILESYMDEVQDTIKSKKGLPGDTSKINYNLIVPFDPNDTTLSDEDIMEYLIEQGFEENPELSN